MDHRTRFGNACQDLGSLSDVGPSLGLETLSISATKTVFYTVQGGTTQTNSFGIVLVNRAPCQVSENSEESFINKRVVPTSRAFFLFFDFCIRDPSQIGIIE